MSNIDIVERAMTEAELAQEVSGFHEYGREHGNPKEESERLGFVAMDGENFAGCASGLSYKKTTGYANWFYLTDLFVEKPLRGQGLGAQLLKEIEEKVVSLGIGNIWLWTAGYEAPGFYKKQGYEVFVEMDNWYSSGHSRVGLRKNLVT